MFVCEISGLCYIAGQGLHAEYAIREYGIRGQSAATIIQLGQHQELTIRLQHFKDV